MNKAMQELATKAFEALVDTLTDYQAPAAERVHAAQTILDYAYRFEQAPDDKPSAE